MPIYLYKNITIYVHLQAAIIHRMLGNVLSQTMTLHPGFRFISSNQITLNILYYEVNNDLVRRSAEIIMSFDLYSVFEVGDIALKHLQVCSVDNPLRNRFTPIFDHIGAGR